MRWYKVVKTIKGHRYHYLQRTYRVRKQVKTENRYIGPAASTSARNSASKIAVPLTPEDVQLPIAPEVRFDGDMDKVLQRRQRLIAQHAAGKISLRTLERRLALNDTLYDQLSTNDEPREPDKVADALFKVLDLVEGAKKVFKKSTKRKRRK